MTTATIDKCLADKTEMPSEEERRARQREADKDAIAKHGTTRIRLRQSLAGAKFAYERGDVLDWRADEAQRLIEAGIAAPVTTKRPRKAG